MSSIVWRSSKHAIIRKAVTQILHASFGYGHGRCQVDYFVMPLNRLIGGVSLDGDAHSFTEDIIRKAFENNNPSSFADCRVAIGVDIDGILHVRSGRQGSHRNARIVCDIGLFCDMESAIRGGGAADDDDLQIPRLMIRSINLDSISQNIKDALLQFAEKEKSVKIYPKQAKLIGKEEEGMEQLQKENPEIGTIRMQLVENKRRQNELMEKLMATNEAVKRITTTLNEAVDAAASARCNIDVCEEILLYDYLHEDDKRANKSLLDDRMTLHYYLDGAGGILDLLGMPSNRVIVQSDLEKGLLLPVLNDAKEVNFDTQFLGGRPYHVPSYHELVVKNREPEKKKIKFIVDRFKQLFSKEISAWSLDAKRIFTAMSLFGYGCSDEGIRFIMGGTLSGMFGEVGMDIQGEQISNAVPCGKTLKNWEIDLATDCIFGLCWELKQAKVQQLGITTDHSHRKGQDHLVKLLSFPRQTCDDDYTIDFLCLNVDSAGHSTEEASRAVSDDVLAFLDILRQFVPNVKLSVITGNAGGGASVQHLHPALQANGTMDKWSKRLSCDLHNLNKALEVACIDAWGRQGIGHLTPFQMIWLLSGY
jgi:hypothetical protein